jgi:DNA-directed RNA polymerase specialized sigma24 family protein
LVAERHRRVVTGEEFSDTDLLVLSRTRPEMLGVVYERHAPDVYRYLGRRVGVGAAEDLLGDVFVAAVGARLRVHPHDSGSALPWLYGIAGNVVRSYRRRSLGQIPQDQVTAVDWDAVDERLDAGSRRQEL